MKKTFYVVLALVTALFITIPVVVQAQSSEYEVWLVARKPENSFVPMKDDAGHAWIAIVRKDSDAWKTDTTYGFWPDSSDKKEPLVNQKDDYAQTDKIIKGESVSKRGFAVRKAKIGINRANWIKNGAYREAGCSTYVAFAGTGNGCNCADYATREWHFLSASQEDFRIRAITINLTLDYLVDEINNKNLQSKYLDNGNTWE